jgi:hypothetical protein
MTKFILVLNHTKVMTTTQDILIAGGYRLAALTLTDLFEKDWSLYRSMRKTIIKQAESEAAVHQISLDTLLLYTAQADCKPAEQLPIAKDIMTGKGEMFRILQEGSPAWSRNLCDAEGLYDTRLIQEIRDQFSDASLLDSEKAADALSGIQNYLTEVMDRTVKWEQVMI